MFSTVCRWMVSSSTLLECLGSASRRIGGNLKLPRLSGVLALNGGGGEIFRNFFYLPDRPLSTREIVWAFYSQFDSRCFVGSNGPQEYRDRLAEKIGDAVGVSGRRLTRAEVERIFPVFRCRYWMGKNSSINNRLGRGIGAEVFAEFAVAGRTNFGSECRFGALVIQELGAACRCSDSACQPATCAIHFSVWTFIRSRHSCSSTYVGLDFHP